MDRAGSLTWSGRAAQALTEIPGPERADSVLFASLVDAHYRRTYGFSYRMVGNEQDAADLTQETFVRVYRALPRLRADGAAAAWIRRIAANLCLDHLRRRRNSPFVSSLQSATSPDGDAPPTWEISDPTGQPERLFDCAESSRLLHRAVMSLPDSYRTVIVLHHMEELRVDEIAEMLGVPIGTIKSRLSRARRELRRKLTPWFATDAGPSR